MPALQEIPSRLAELPRVLVHRAAFRSSSTSILPIFSIASIARPDFSRSGSLIISTNTVGTQHVVTCTVRNAQGQPVQGEGDKYEEDLHHHVHQNAGAIELRGGGFKLHPLATLGAKRGPVLFQLPARFKADGERLASFLKLLSKKYKYAFEFRDASWYEDDIVAALDALPLRSLFEAPSENLQMLYKLFSGHRGWFLVLITLPFAAARNGVGSDFPGRA